MRRELDPALMKILKTETRSETRLRTDPRFKAAYIEEMASHSGDRSVYRPLKNDVTVARHLRYVSQPPHRTFLVEMRYMASGQATIRVGERCIELHQGDIFIPNQYTTFAIDELGADDIMLNFVIKPRFFEDTYVQLKKDTLLSDFMLDTLQKDASWNRYLHFRGMDNLVVFNLIEAMAFVAFPYLDDDNVLMGCDPDPRISAELMRGVFVGLSREMDSLAVDSPTNFDEVIRQTTRSYLGEQYMTASLRELAETLGQSESALSRQIKTLFGFTFKELLLQKRFERAVTLLTQTNLPVANIAESVGYENTSFFYRRFKELYGISPKDYRKDQGSK